jgi:hypothetical protein
MTIVSEIYYVGGDALHYYSLETISYSMTSSAPPLFGEINQPFDNEGFNEDGPPVLHASSLATRYVDGGDVVFLVEQNPYDSYVGFPTYLPAEAHTTASLQVDFTIGGQQNDLWIEIISQAGHDGRAEAHITDLDTGESWALVPEDVFAGVTWAVLSVDPTHTYRLGLNAWDVQWAPSSIVVRFEGVPVPLPGASVLVVIGAGLIRWLRQHRMLQFTPENLRRE